MAQGYALKEAREAAGITQVELAAAMFAGRRTIVRWERDDVVLSAGKVQRYREALERAIAAKSSRRAA